MSVSVIAGRIFQIGVPHIRYFKYMRDDETKILNNGSLKVICAIVKSYQENGILTSVQIS